MNAERVAVAWVLVLVLGLLLGLLLAVVAFGVVRRMRRPKTRRDAERGASTSKAGAVDADEPNEWRSSGRAEDSEDE